MEITRELPHDYSKISEIKDLRSTYIAHCSCVQLDERRSIVLEHHHYMDAVISCENTFNNIACGR